MMRNSPETVYGTAVRSELGATYAMALEGMEAKDGDMSLKSKIVDQPHLHGILESTKGLGLQLLSVPDDAYQSAGAKREQKESKP